MQRLGGVLRVVERLCVVLMLGIVVLTAVQVMLRKLASPLVWSNDMTALMLVWVSLLGAVLVQAERDHVRVDFVTALFGPGVKKVLSIGWKLAVIVMLITMVVVSPSILRASLTTYPSTLPISMVWYRGAILAMAVLGSLVLLCQMIEDLHGASDDKAEEGEA